MSSFGWNLEVDLIVIFVEVFLLLQVRRNNFGHAKGHYFAMVGRFTITLAAADLLWVLMKFGYLTWPMWVAYVAVDVVIIATMFVCYSWLAYTECVIDTNWLNNKLKRIIVVLPAVVMAVLIIISGFSSNLFFSVSTDFTYYRESSHIAIMLIDVLYIVYAGMHTHLAAQKIENYVRRKELNNLLSFMIFPLAGILAVQKFYDLPYLSAAIMMAMICTYLGVLDNHIRQDSLCNISNKYHMIAYLEDHMRSIIGNHEKDIYFVMLDIDDFKSINDTYGHVMGDRVLVQVAQSIKIICGEFGCFGARYAGDEFAIVIETASIDKIRLIVKRINELMEKMTNMPRPVTVSIGYASMKRENTTSSKELIRRADERLYEVKAAKKKNIKL